VKKKRRRMGGDGGEGGGRVGGGWGEGEEIELIWRSQFYCWIRYILCQI
jgi:hypothetical protein